MGKGTAKKHKALKVILIVLAVMVVLSIGGFFIAATHTQIVVGFIQKMADNGKPLNSYEPLNEPQNGEEKPHCFIANERTDATSKDAFDRLLAFLESNT